MGSSTFDHCVLNWKLPSLVLAFVFVQCSSRGQSKPVPSTQDLNVKDCITRDIPKFFQGEKWRKNYRANIAALNVQSLTNGFDSLQIRFWIDRGYQKDDSSRLLVISKDSFHSFESLYTYTSSYDSADGTIIRTTGTFTSLRPKKNWDSLIDTLMSMGVTTLRDFSTIKAYNLDTHPYGVMVEIASKSTYKIYDYLDYKLHANSIPEAKRMLDIMKFLEREFDVRLVY